LISNDEHQEEDQARGKAAAIVAANVLILEERFTEQKGC
jgi:hypothetical protein